MDSPRTIRALLILLWLIGGAALSGLALFTVGKLVLSNATVALLLLHGALGLAAAAVALLIAPGRWKQFWSRREERERGYALGLYTALAAAAVTGLVFTVPLYQFGNGERFTWILPVHAAAGCIVAILLLLRFTRVANRPRLLSSLAAAVVLLTALGAALPFRPDSTGYISADRYYQDLASATPVEAGSSLFPGFPRAGGGSGAGSASSDTGHTWSDASAACASCHPDAAREWASSAHRHAGFDDPFYARALSILARREGKPAARFCAGCHDPARLLNGADVSQAPAPGEVTGITCLTCHTISGFSSLSGNGAFIVSPPGGFASGVGASGSLASWRQLALKLYPAAHAFAMGRTTSRAALCGSCHRMSVNLALNHYKFVRVQDDYGAWLRSPQSGREARAFYPLAGPAAPRDCASCHMIAASGEIDHGFAAGDTALDAVLARTFKDSAAQLRSTARSLASRAITVDLFSAAISTGGREVNLTPLPASENLPGGAEVVLSVVVTNRGVGHTFPAGDTDARDCWLDLQARSASGRLIGESGGILPDGAVDPDAHRYGTLWLDRSARPVLDRNLEKAVTPLYQRLIAAGASDVARYRFRMPPSGAITITAALKYRSIGLETARALGQTLVPPTTVVARAAARLIASPGAIPAAGASHLADAERWNAYGIGCMIQGDAQDASQAFLMTQRLLPRAIEGFINLGRLYLQQGRPLDAARQFALALRIRPGDPTARAWLGQYYLGVGQYSDALRELQSALGAFPRDPTLWFDAGRSHFQRGEYPAAAQAFQKSLALDPDQVDAHYQLMRTYLALHRVDESHLERAIYLYLKDDESMDQVVNLYASRHPAARLEMLPMQAHTLALDGGRRTKTHRRGTESRRGRANEKRLRVRE